MALNCDMEGGCFLFAYRVDHSLRTEKKLFPFHLLRQLEHVGLTVYFLHAKAWGQEGVKCFRLGRVVPYTGL